MMIEIPIKQVTTKTVGGLEGLAILILTALLAVLFCWKHAGGMMLLTMIFLSLAMYWSFSVILSDGAKSWLSPAVLLWFAGFACFACTRLIGRASRA